MARYRYTIAAAVLFVGLLVWVLLNERGRVPESGEVFGLDVKNVTRFEITPRDNKPVTFEKRGDQWWITAPFQGWANKDEVERIAKSLCELKPSKRPDADSKSKEFGLDNPFVTARIFVGSRKYEISLGNEAPVGGENFASVTGEKGVFIVPAFLKTDLLKKPEDMRDKKLVHYAKEDVVSLDLTNTKGTFHIDGKQAADATNKDKDWFLTQPIAAKADRWAVADTLTAKPADTEAKLFEDAPRDLASVGLDKPSVKLSLKLQDGKTVTIFLGAKVRKSVPRDNAPGTPGTPNGPSGNEDRDLIYAMVDGRPELMLVDATFFTDLDKDLMQLRDKHILLVDRAKIRTLSVQRKTGFSFSLAKRTDIWFMDSPQPAKAKQTKVEDMLWNLEDLETGDFIEKPDLKQYGLAVPEAVLTIGLADGKTVKLIFGFKNKDGRYYLKRDDQDTVYTVSDLLLSGLPKAVDELKGSADEGALPPMGSQPGMPPGMAPGGPGGPGGPQGYGGPPPGGEGGPPPGGEGGPPPPPPSH